MDKKSIPTDKTSITIDQTFVIMHKKTIATDKKFVPVDKKVVTIDSSHGLCLNQNDGYPPQNMAGYIGSKDVSSTVRCLSTNLVSDLCFLDPQSPHARCM